MEIATCWLPRINIESTYVVNFYTNIIASKYLWKIIKKTWHIRKRFKTTEIATFWSLGTHPRIAPYLQKHPKGFPGPSQDAPRDAPPFLVPPGTPQGPPRNPQFLFWQVPIRKLSQNISPEACNWEIHEDNSCWIPISRSDLKPKSARRNARSD